MTCPTVRGVHWAVLSAYAQILPFGERRTRARTLAWRCLSLGGEMGRALVLALDLGLTRRAPTTVAGMLLAPTLLAATSVYGSRSAGSADLAACSPFTSPGAEAMGWPRCASPHTWRSALAHAVQLGRAG